MEDGRLTDSSGRVVSFKQALIVLTSNVGSTAIAGGIKHVGFDLSDGEKDSERLQALVKDEMKAQFKPEFLNRIDEIVVCFLSWSCGCVVTVCGLLTQLALIDAQACWSSLCQIKIENTQEQGKFWVR